MSSNDCYFLNVFILITNYQLLITILKHMSHLQEGASVPSAIFKTRVRDESVAGENPFRWQDLSTDDIFKGKNIVIFGLPGAYTPTCSTTHAPGYEAVYDEMKALGVDEVICLSVNDAFVMYNWKKHLGLQKIFMLPDGNGDFTRDMGMLVKKNNLGFGERSWRYSMHVVDGVIKKMFVEEGISDNYASDPFDVSDGETMLKYLKNI